MSGFDDSRDDAFLIALAHGQAINAAAREAGLSVATAHRRLRDQQFVRRLTATRSSLWAAALAKLAQAATTAVDRLVKLVDEADSDAVRLAACKAILDCGSKLRSDVETDARLRALEDGSGDDEQRTTEAA